MRFTLLFGEWELGSVHEDDADFPTFFGNYELSPELANVPQLRHLLDYVAFSIKRWPLIEADRLDEAIGREEEQFIDLVESEAWALRDEAGALTPILIPNFGTAGQICWRLNPTIDTKA
jgi:hypothetical protein